MPKFRTRWSCGPQALICEPEQSTKGQPSSKETIPCTQNVHLQDNPRGLVKKSLLLEKVQGLFYRERDWGDNYRNNAHT